jgi:hypothetical protein
MRLSKIENKKVYLITSKLFLKLSSNMFTLRPLQSIQVIDVMVAILFYSLRTIKNTVISTKKHLKRPSNSTKRLSTRLMGKEL